MQVEVFKTNIYANQNADRLILLIHQSFSAYEANFDLEDCDHILRIACNNGNICTQSLVSFLEIWGCCAEPLPD